MASISKSEDARFRFGENWQSFVATVTPEAIAEAERGIARLLPPEELRGRRVLDIGCGSGLSALAMLRQGAAAVDAIDLDPQSVAAATALLQAFAPGGAWSVRRADVLTLTPPADTRYDIVYSWGVLHHTGALWRAVERAAAMLAPGGMLAVALYRRTPFCPLWRVEKRLYTRAGPAVQAALRGAYKAGFAAALLATGRSPRGYVAGYRSARGMDWHHDVHDWLGGYPYESATPAEVVTRLERLGLTPLRVFEHRAALGGLFGSHCDEYVARKK